MKTTSSNLQLPKVSEYVDVRQYLSAIYERRKKNEPSFSYTTWAEELGLQSRTFLKLMIAGKRSITERSLPLFINGLGLNTHDAQYFSTLVRLSRASTAAERNLHMNELCQSRRAPSKRTNSTQVLDHYRFLSNPLGPRLQSLLMVEKKNPWTPVELADHLGVRVPEIQEALRVLKSLGLAREENRPDGNSGYRSNTPDFEVEDHLGSLALQSFHRESLSDAVRAIDLDPALRRFQAMFLMLTPEQLGAVHKKVQSFVSEILESYPSTEPSNEARLYQFNFNAIPVSKPVLRTEKSLPVPAGINDADVRAAGPLSQKEIEV